METLLELADVAGQAGRTVYFLNLPAPLRLHAEVCGAPLLVPIKRERKPDHASPRCWPSRGSAESGELSDGDLEEESEAWTAPRIGWTIE